LGIIYPGTTIPFPLKNRGTGIVWHRIDFGYIPVTIGLLLQSLQVGLVITLKIRGRNRVAGTVMVIRKGLVCTEVVIAACGGHEMASSITTNFFGIAQPEGRINGVSLVVRASGVRVMAD